MQAELRAIREEKLEKYLQVRNNERQLRTYHQIPDLSSTSILSVKNANRQIDNQKVEEMKKNRQRILQENEKDKAKEEAEKAAYKKQRIEVLTTKSKHINRPA